MTYQRKAIILQCAEKKMVAQNPHCPTILVKLTGISKYKNFPNEQIIAQQKLQKP